MATKRKNYHRIVFLGKDFRLVSYDTKLGKTLSERCEHWDGNYLGQVYNRWSDRKQRIFDDWFDYFCKDSCADNFSIVSHNCQTFSLGWFTTLQDLPVKYYQHTGKIVGKDVSILITPSENYMIVYPE